MCVVVGGDLTNSRYLLAVARLFSCSNSSCSRFTKVDDKQQQIVTRIFQSMIWIFSLFEKLSNERR